ncbi:MAG: TM2 domain-containing protein [Bacteroidetes bacterium]|nr:TM2 domain-containing protein [Bacteroidota bacterium]
MDQKVLSMLPGLEADEMMYIQELLKNLSEDQQKQFILLYQGKRKDPQTILIFTLVGFLGFAGIQRFAVDEIGMGIAYLFTGGFCGIGTIIDLINHKKLTSEFNRKKALECCNMAKVMAN